MAIIVYEGINVSLGVLEKWHITHYLPYINRRLSIEGTMQRGPYTEDMGLEWLKSQQEKREKNEVFAVYRHDDSGEERQYVYIGNTSLHDINREHSYATSGSMLFSFDDQGKGLGTEAKLLLLYHAFRVLGLRKVNSDVKAFNAKSLGHLIKTGFKIIGRREKHHFHDGDFVDNILLEIFRDSWEKIWARYKADGTLPKLTKKEHKRIEKETNIKNN